MNQRLYFASDYMEGAHSSIINRLVETNLDKTVGYGLDPISESARSRIREACQAPESDVYFLIGGTQTNGTVISAILRSWEGVIAARSGHISTHEAGTIEASGHKVLTLPPENGKISADAVDQLVKSFFADENHDHTVEPGMVYISQPTEDGTLYSLAELEKLSEVCRRHHLPLYVDGARLAYALATPENDVTLPDLARLCDAFYIGGTKCGALFGEAVVFPKRDIVSHFFTTIKQHGALLAKGRLLGIQFDELFRDDLYLTIGASAVRLADQIRQTLKDNNYDMPIPSPTNQVFTVLDDAFAKELSETVEYGFWEKYDETHTVVRFATSWATTQEDVDALCRILEKY